MTDSMAPLDYGKVETAIRGAINRQEELTRDFTGTSDEAGYAEATFKTAYSEAWLRAKTTPLPEGGKLPSDSYADHLATVATGEQRTDMEAAKARHDAVRQGLLTTRTRIEALRSLMASYREGGG